jgi:nucleotidyltransferase substrate binding protein (TIGR01987 family)
MLDTTKFGKSLEHLEAQAENYKRIPERDNLAELDIEAVKESVIQRFEVCYDCMWKTLKRYMRENLGLPELPNSPKPLFRIAFENNLLSPPVEKWLSYADARVGTSQDYSSDKAVELLAQVEDFIADAKKLYALIRQ